MRITTVRIIVQTVTMGLFLAFVFLTTMASLSEMPALRFWLSKFLEIDPLVGFATSVTTHTLYKGLTCSLILLTPTLLLGRFFCGWICPFGTLHQVVGWVLNRRNVKQKIESNRYRSMYQTKYLILVGMLRGEAPMQVLSGPVGRERVHYEAPPRDRLDAEMEQFLKWFNSAPSLDNTLRACLAHLWFETLHPFEDGNGRIGRAVFDLALAQGAAFHSARISRRWAVSPVILELREEYYSQLERAQKGDLDVTEWLQWSGACVGRAYEEAHTCIGRVGLIAKFWVRHRDTALNPRQRKALEIALSPNETEDAWLTAKRVARWTKVERVTASRDLTQLETLGVIRKDPAAGGRSTRYEVALEEPESAQLVANRDWT